MKYCFGKRKYLFSWIAGKKRWSPSITSANGLPIARTDWWTPMAILPWIIMLISTNPEEIVRGTGILRGKPWYGRTAWKWLAKDADFLIFKDGEPWRKP